MLSAISGQRMLFNFFRVGGVNFDTNDEFLSRLGTWRSNVMKNIEMNERMITDNEIFRARTIGMGTSDRPGGHLARSDRDRTCAHRACRSTSARRIPYSIYHELEFDVITQQSGDSYARYLQRIAEIKQSIHLIDQIIDKHAARTGPGAGAGHHPPQAGPRLRRRSSLRAGCTACTPSATAARTRIGSGCATPASSASRRCPRSCPASWSPIRWPSWRASTRSWAAWTSNRWTSTLLLGLGRFLLATTLLLLLTVPTAFVIIQMEMKVIAGWPALRPEPDRAERASSRAPSTASRCWPRRTPSPTRPIARPSPLPRGWSTWPRR